MPEPVLLDTHAAIWFSEGSLKTEALSALVAARVGKQAFVSPVTAWEAGILANRRRYLFSPDPYAWYDQLIGPLGLEEAGLTWRILLDSTMLPGVFHNDPADRMLVATARKLGVPLMTRDASIHAYAAQGHCQVVAC